MPEPERKEMTDEEKIKAKDHLLAFRTKFWHNETKEIQEANTL